MNGVDAGKTIPPKLNLWETIYISYSTYFKNFGDVWEIVRLWIVIAVPVLALANYIRYSSLVTAFTQGAERAQVLSAGNLALFVFSTILCALAAISIAVAWHRRLILDERPVASASNVLTANVWRYIGVGFITFFFATLPLFVLFLLFLFQSHTSRAYAGLPQSLIFLLAVIVSIVVTLRFSFLLPARAVRNLSLTFEQSWTITRGNTWRLFWGAMACTAVPVFAAQILLAGLIGLLGLSNFFGGSLPARLVAINAISMAYYFFIAPIGIGFLSRAYHVLYELNLPGRGEPSATHP